MGGKAAEHLGRFHEFGRFGQERYRGGGPHQENAERSGVLMVHRTMSLSIDSDHISRPDATSCLVHPFFWGAGQRLEFLQEVSDKFNAMRRKPGKDLTVLETNASNVLNGDWMEQLSKPLVKDLENNMKHRNYKVYDGTSVQELLRVLRNKVSRPKCCL